MRTVAVAFVLLLCLGSVVPLQAQVLPSPLVIESITLKDDAMPRVEVHDESFYNPDWKATDTTRSRISAEVQVIIKNVGNRPSLNYDLFYYWENPAGDRFPLNGYNAGDPSPPGGTNAQSSDSGSPLQFDDTREHKITWSAQDYQLGPGTLVVELSESTNQESSIDVFVKQHNIQVDWQDHLPVAIHPDETLYLPLKILNAGNHDEDVEWTVLVGHVRLVTSLRESSATYGPGEHSNDLVIRYPFKGSITDVNDIVLQIQAKTGVQQQTLHSVEIDIVNDELPPPPSVDVAGPARAVFADAGQTVPVTFTLTNTGSSPDTYTLSAVDQGDWDVGSPTINGQSIQSVSLAGGTSTAVEILARPLAGASRIATITLTATSAAGATDSGLGTVKLAGPYPVVTSLRLDHAPVYVGDEAVVSVAFENAGNALMEGATLTLRVTFGDGSATSQVINLDPVEAGRSRVQRYSMGTALGPGTAMIIAELRDGTLDATESYNDFVRLADLGLTAPLPLPGLPGEIVRYHTPPHAFQVTNNGNTDEHLNLKVTGATLVGDAAFVLAIGQTRTVAVTQNIPPETGDAAVYDVTLEASLRDAPDRKFSGVVHTPVRDDEDPSVSWIEAPDTLLAYTSAPLRVTASDDTFVSTVWVVVAPADPTSDAGSFQVVLHETDVDWSGLLTASGPAGLTLTPFAEDAYGNVGSGPSRALQVTSKPPPPPAPVVEATLDVANITAKGAEFVVHTTAAKVLVAVDGNQSTHDVVEGVVRGALELTPGVHTINITVEQDGIVVTRTVTLEVPAQEDSPGLLGRLTPAPGPIWILAALLLAAFAVRRLRP